MGWMSDLLRPSPEGRGGSSMTVSEHNRTVNGMGPGREAPIPLWRKLLFGEQRAVTNWDVWGQDGSGSRTNSGTYVNETNAFKFQVVYSAITLIADGVASLPPQAFVESEDGTMEPAGLPNWIRKPHPEMRRFDVWNQLLISVLAWGNGYAQFIRRPSDGVIVGLSVLDPVDVTVEWDPNRLGYRRYKIMNGPWLTAQEVFHIQGPTLPGREKGMSVIAQAREAIGLGLTLEEFGARYFGQGSQAKIVIELPGSQVPDEGKAKAIVSTFERFHRGKGNWHRPALVTGGAKLHNISIPPEDAQFLQSREFQASTVAGWFRVPPHRVGLTSKSTSWGSGLAEENLAMLQHTFRPWILRLEGALTSYAPGGEDRGLIIKLGDDVLQRGTFKEAAETWGKLVELGIATPDEGRTKLGLKPLGGEAAKLRDPNAQPAGGPADPRSKEDDRIRKQDEAAGRSRKDKDVLDAHYRADSRHLPGKHDQSSHGKGGGHGPGPGTADHGEHLVAATRLSELSPAGQAQVAANMEKYGLTHEALVDEIKSKVTPENFAAGKDWYREAHEFNADLADRSGLSFQTTVGITAAVSPRMKWEVPKATSPDNKKIAEKIAMKFRDYDGMEPVAAAEKMGGVIPEMGATGIKLARGGSIDSTLTGVKRRSFYNNMLDPDNSQHVTVDTHMMKVVKFASTREKPIAKGDVEKFIGAAATSTKGGAGYVAISEAIHSVAGDMGVLPHEVQAAYWLQVQKVKWSAPVGGNK